MMKTNSAMNWTVFFRSAGIPDAATLGYCQSFVKNRIQQSDLQDLDKETLAQLGVKAIGDQLAILRYIKQGSGQSKTTTNSTASTKTVRNRIEAPDSSSSSNASDASLASFHRKGRPPPDSHEIYHVKMPQGTTARTRKILLTAQKNQPGMGTIRGTTGVRQGGRPVEPIDKNSVAVQNMRQDLGMNGHKRLINQHLAGRQVQTKRAFAQRTLTVLVPERNQQRSRITYGETSAVARTIVNKPIAKVVGGSRIMKRVERPGARTISERITFSTGRSRGNRNIQYVDADEEDVIYEDDVDDAMYEEEDDGYVEYEQPRQNVFSRVTL